MAGGMSGATGIAGRGCTAASPAGKGRQERRRGTRPALPPGGAGQGVTLGLAVQLGEPVMTQGPDVVYCNIVASSAAELGLVPSMGLSPGAADRAFVQDPGRRSA
jgi:hypothetical protein